MDAPNLLWAFGLTLFAGLSTGLGRALAFFAKGNNREWLSVALGFSAGVMLYVSFIEILPEAQDCLTTKLTESGAHGISVLAFFAGIALIGIVDRLIPPFENPHQVHRVAEMDEPVMGEEFRSLYRLGLFTALAIVLHSLGKTLAC